MGPHLCYYKFIDNEPKVNFKLTFLLITHITHNILQFSCLASNI